VLTKLTAPFPFLLFSPLATAVPTADFFICFFSQRRGPRDVRDQMELVLQEEVLPRVLLFRVLDRVHLVDARPEVVRIPPESDLQRLQKLVHPAEQGLGRIGPGRDRWDAVEHDDPVGEVCGHDEIVLYDEGGLFGVEDEPLDDFGGVKTLLRVQVSRGFVDQIDVGGTTQA